MGRGFFIVSGVVVAAFLMAGGKSFFQDIEFEEIRKKTGLRPPQNSIFAKDAPSQADLLRAELGEVYDALQKVDDPEHRKLLLEAADKAQRKLNPPVVRNKNVHEFTIKMTSRKKTCQIKVVQNMPGFKERTIGFWSGDIDQCEPKFKELINTMNEVSLAKRRVNL